ncbi:hypothetical protein [Methylomicrobium sp. Wu6]|uniref:hypothetical protein n=1 Tax=Methylomicrobium sp. Wu6 TaxID=3107928 RepID=UPI002DD6672E|nr:hypothetical protein [Methylomicrobium sp. Wu6]
MKSALVLALNTNLLSAKHLHMSVIPAYTQDTWGSPESATARMQTTRFPAGMTAFMYKGMH